MYNVLNSWWNSFPTILSIKTERDNRRNCSEIVLLYEKIREDGGIFSMSGVLTIWHGGILILIIFKMPGKMRARNYYIWFDSKRYLKSCQGYIYMYILILDLIVILLLLYIFIKQLNNIMQLKKITSWWKIWSLSNRIFSYNKRSSSCFQLTNLFDVRKHATS